MLSELPAEVTTVIKAGHHRDISDGNAFVFTVLEVFCRLFQTLPGDPAGQALFFVGENLMNIAFADSQRL